MSASRSARPDPATARLAAWIEPVVGAAGFDLEDLVVTPAGRRSIVRVVVDRDQGVTLDDIADVSRAVSETLDAEDGAMGRAPYVLEVTSPGVDRPLTEARHWRRNTGRMVVVPVGPAGHAAPLTGRITRVDDDGVVLAVESAGSGKPGARRRPPTDRHVPWAELGAGRVQVEFGRSDAGPATGADDDSGDDIGDDISAEFPDEIEDDPDGDPDGDADDSGGGGR